MVEAGARRVAGCASGGLVGEEGPWGLRPLSVAALEGVAISGTSKATAAVAGGGTA